MLMKGRILFETFIYTATPALAGIDASDASPVYIIDIERSLLPNLKTHLKRYKLRSKFETLEIPSDKLQIFSVWPSLPPDMPPSENANTMVIPDPRSHQLGVRLLTNKSPPHLPLHSVEVYHIRRTLHGVPEGPEEILENAALPGESNLDVLHGVDYTKGCYVGQELTSRTYHTGVIRKRLLPVSIFPEKDREPMTLAWDAGIEVDLPSSGTRFIAEGEKRSPGRFLRGWGNIGWGLCRLDYVEKVLRCEWKGKSVCVKPFLPEWAEVEDVTSKQKEAE
jgi:transferase CAF17, mitochondrial